MILKEIIGVLLLFGSLQMLAADNIDKSTEINYHELHSKQVNDFPNPKQGYRKKYKDAELQFQKDYNKWGEKKSSKYEFKDDRDVNINEIDSKEYVDKYNKYGHTFRINPNVLYSQKEKTTDHKKMSMYDEKHHEEHEKPGSLLHDIDVNYVNNKKEMSEDSEFIKDEKDEKHLEEHGKPRSLIRDVDVNYVTDKKEFVTERSERKNKEDFQENYQNGKELYMKRFKKDFYQNLIKIDSSKPPPANDTVSMARYIVHTVDWAVLGTLSGRSPTKGSPFVCVKATSDGMQNASSGIPFFYMSPMDLCTQDLQKDNRVSILVTLSETEYCKNQNYDPQDPRCAKLTLSGKIKKIKAGSDEEKFAKNALFSRHPAMESWPAGHNWYFTKLKIGQIVLLDQFGGAAYIKVKDYLNGKVMEPELRK